jgi:hypothetical protein
MPEVGELITRGRARLVVVAALIALFAFPAGAQAFSKAIWGAPYRHGVNQFPLYKKLRVKIVETRLNWAQVAARRPRDGRNPRDRAYRWPKDVNQTVNLAKRYHMQVLIQIMDTPRWANGGRAQNVPPRLPAFYANFARAAARNYRSVHLWMVWGEPSRSATFALTPTLPANHHPTHAQTAAPRFYARMLDAAYGQLKAVSRHNLVIGGNTYTTGGITTEDWIKNLRLPNGKRPRMDMYGHNPFSFEAPNFHDPPSPYGEVQFSDLPELAGWIDRYLRRGMKIFVSEFTVPTKPDQEFNFYVDPPVAARWVKSALSLSRHWNRIYGLGWVHVYDNPPNSYGGLLTTAGKPKPDYYTFGRG